MSNVIAFPPRPTKPEALGYWFSGGDIFFNADGRGVHLERWQAEAARDFWGKQAERLGAINPSSAEARMAVRRWCELGNALDAQLNHRLITGRTAR